MKTLILIAFTATILVAVYSFTNPKVDFKADTKEGIQFYRGTWEEALQLAQKENKLIFLDIYATWCGPCKKLKAYTFSDEEVGDYYNANFINVALDGEKGEGALLAQKYKIRGYPTLLFVNGDGRVIGQTTGYHSAKDLLKLGNKYKN